MNRQTDGPQHHVVSRSEGRRH